MSIILDVIIILIILLFIFLSAKKGFVKSLVEVVGFVAAVVIALSVSTPIANIIYDGAVQPIVAKTVENAVSESQANTTEAIDTIWNKLPAFLTDNNFFSLSKDDITISVTNDNIIDTVQLTDNINSFLKPAVSKILSVLISVILLIILLFVVKLSAKLLNKLFSFSIVGNINRTLGGILGFIKGCAFAIVFCMAISLILSFTKNGFLIFTYDSINSSYLFKFFMGLSPFL